jgi:uncharacterized protein (DUF362 family)
VPDILPYLEALVQLAHPEGGWGYRPGQSAHLEPTCLGLLALTRRPDLYIPSATWKGLERWAQPDGSYRRAGDRDEAVWPTALVLFVKAVLRQSGPTVDRAAARLLAVRAMQPDNEQAHEVHDINFRLLGWPWAEGNFSWVEPTAWACLALRRAGYGAQGRVQEGLRLLIDRAFDDGGINYGNRFVLGKRTEPIPTPTALMLLALQGQTDHPRIAASVVYLLQQVAATDDLQHLCWSRLALTVHEEREEIRNSLPDLDAKIIRAYQTRSERSWLAPSPYLIALTVLALSADHENPFRLPAETERSTRAQIPPGTLTLAPGPRKRGWTQRFASAFRGLAVEAVGRLRQMPPQANVHIARATDYNADLADVVRRQYESFRQQVPLVGKRVVLKPNLVEYHRDKVINTNPKVVAAAIELCKREGAAEVIVAEGPGHWRNVEYLVEASGLGDVLRHYGVPFIDLNHDEPVKYPNLGRLTGLEDLFLSRTVATAEVLISLPKLKTHHWAGATLSLKNQFGTLPGICYGWPKNELHWRGIDNSIVDIALTRPPDLALVDGIIGMEGDGPLNGTAKPFGALILGADPVAVDATCCRLMQLDPERIKYLGLAYQKKLGLLRSAEIVQIGEAIADLAQPFDTIPAFKELQLARSA